MSLLDYEFDSEYDLMLSAHGKGTVKEGVFHTKLSTIYRKFKKNKHTCGTGSAELDNQYQHDADVGANPQAEQRPDTRLLRFFRRKIRGGKPSAFQTSGFSLCQGFF